MNVHTRKRFVGITMVIKRNHSERKETRFTRPLTSVKSKLRDTRTAYSCHAVLTLPITVKWFRVITIHMMLYRYGDSKSVA